MSRQARAAGTQTGRSAPPPRRGDPFGDSEETDWSAGACVKRRKVEREDRAARSIPRRPEKSYVATPQRIRSGGGDVDAYGRPIGREGRGGACQPSVYRVLAVSALFCTRPATIEDQTYRLASG